MEYELVREIKNLCRNNQMRDVFFEEVECNDPADYVRAKHGKDFEKFTREDLPDGKTVYRYDNVLSWIYEFTEL